MDASTDPGGRRAVIALRRLARLSWADWSLLIGSGVLVGVVRLLLLTQSWHTVRSALRRLRPLLRAAAGGASADRIVWAVSRASRVVPGATCLTQALAMQSALTAVGAPSTVEIGAARDAAGAVRFHAWLVHAGRVITTAERSATPFTRMLTVEADLSQHPATEPTPRVREPSRSSDAVRDSIAGVRRLR